MPKTRQRACSPLTDEQLEALNKSLSQFFDGMAECPDPQNEHSEDWIDGWVAAAEVAQAVIPMWLNADWQPRAVV